MAAGLKVLHVGLSGNPEAPMRLVHGRCAGPTPASESGRVESSLIRAHLSCELERTHDNRRPFPTLIGARAWRRSGRVEARARGAIRPRAPAAAVKPSLGDAAETRRLDRSTGLMRNRRACASASKTDNAFVESIKGRFRTECPNANRFLSLDEARRKCEAWRKDCRDVRPHRSLGGRRRESSSAARRPQSTEPRVKPEFLDSAVQRRGQAQMCRGFNRLFNNRGYFESALLWDISRAPDLFNCLLIAAE
jgi:hypothetical protein